MAETSAATDDRVRLAPFGDALGFLLRLAQIDSFERFFADLGHLDLRPGELTVIVLLEGNPGVRQGVLAEALKIKRAHMAKMVRALGEAGLIRREVPEDDRRAVELYLTEAGATLARRLRPAVTAHEARTPPTLTPAETATLKRLLRKYLALTDPEGTTP